ncbi:MAG: response regulator [Chitinophagaceae bacterium]|nr:response regulator [Chitinophagaceae bacterium]
MLQGRISYNLWDNVKGYAMYCMVYLLVLMLACPKIWAQPSNSLQFHRLNGLEGAPQGAALCIEQDALGYMWIGTPKGLVRYNSRDYRYYRTDVTDSFSISNNYIVAIKGDEKGIIWIGTRNGLNRYDPVTNRFNRIMTGRDKLHNERVFCLQKDAAGNLWIGTENGLYVLAAADAGAPDFRSVRLMQLLEGYRISSLHLDGKKILWIGTNKGLFTLTNASNNPQLIPVATETRQPEITALASDALGRLWVGTLKQGLFYREAGNEGFQSLPVGKAGILHSFVRSILPDSTGNIWIGTQEGLSVYEPISERFLNFQHEPENPLSLSQNSIYHLFRDRSGSIWIGTYFGGVNVVYASNTPFGKQGFTGRKTGLSNDVVSGMVQEPSGNIWLGTEGGGLNKWNRATGEVTYFKNVPGVSGSLSSNLVKSVSLDKKGNLWVGTHGGGLNKLTSSSGSFQTFYPGSTPGNEGEIKDVTCFLEDSYGRYWVGTEMDGLFRFDGSTFSKDILRPGTGNGVPKTYVRMLFEDDKRNLWAGTETGIFVLPNQGDLFLPIEKWLPGSGFPNNLIANCIIEDSRGRYWIGTEMNGLIRWQPDKKGIEKFAQPQGLPGSQVYGIIDDGRGYLWISTDAGLCRMDVENDTFVNYNISDGLPGNQFNYLSYLKDYNGELYFGGLHGLTHFFPSQIGVNKNKPPVVITGLRLFGKQVQTGDATNILKKSIDRLSTVKLKHHQNVITIEFALLNYIKPYKNNYRWMLEGYEKNWNEGRLTEVTYTNLPQGSYTFRVQASNNDGVWTDRPASIRLIVLPPVWRTTWAFLFYTLAGLAIIFFISRFVLLRAKFRRQSAMQQFKLDFFTNLSHEIRSHLSLIIGPVERLLLGAEDNQQQKRQLLHVKSNADRLMQLVSEMMDLRKAETKHIHLKPEKHNFILFLADIVRNFEAAAAAKQITLRFEYASLDLQLIFDKGQLEKVFFNLLNNALKFTCEGGHIEVGVVDQPDGVQVTVTDNGAGIAAKHLPNIFTTYYQVREGDTHHMGYGLGLAIAKSIVELHNGSIQVQSRKATATETGFTQFTVIIPKGMKQEQRETVSPSAIPASLEQDVEEKEGDSFQVVLVIEDNEELRAFIQESLEGKYHVITASNGELGLEKAFEQIPDLVISDIMMPGLSGFEVCTTLKRDTRTNHIPVILLTARSADEHKLEGMQTGADAYITKPFSIQMLELQIANLLASRAAMKERYIHRVTLQPRNIEITNMDEAFLNEAVTLVEEHLDDPEFGVGMMSSRLAMSKSVLYKKLKALTDMSVNDFIKSIRLKRAAQLLSQTSMHINEVAYNVGYSDRKYFSKEFKKQFGVTPSEYAEGHTSDEGK